eukprot:CAMPEP_0197585426 /NCGR_PEP_ID=MMETSP1326-20131121/7732_1 /TAXON_ID=1155430 /ORGANISM="Genus nov. species nov., Strain RCC2288" /LENGTH=226 /DNA_ID=CAMNT_0043149929 /DNA_START=57 /DNA_END=737 /DNA_ORIENTATION=-
MGGKLSIQLNAGVPNDLKLSYLPVRARGEAPRMMLIHYGVKFEDEVVDFATWGGSRKAEAPFGQLPLLTANGAKLAQSGSIIHYLAEISGCSLRDRLMNARIDVYFELYNEFLNKHPINPIANGFIAKEEIPAKVAACVKDFHDTYCDWFAKGLELLEGPFFGGKRPHYADFAVWSLVDIIMFMQPDLLDKPEVKGLVAMKAWYQAVAELPKIKTYLAARPAPNGH